MFKDRLKLIRTSNNLSQRKFADLFGVSQDLVYKWEKGSSSPDPDTLNKIAETFGVSVDYLTGNTNIIKPIESKLSNDIQSLIYESEGISPEGIEEIRKYAQLVKIKEQVDRSNEAEISSGHAKSG